MQWGGTLVLWQQLDQYGMTHAASAGLTIDEYYDKVRTEG